MSTVQRANIEQLISLVKSLTVEVTEEYMRLMGPASRALGYANAHNPILGCCIFFNFLLYKKLKEHGYDSKYIGGAASFGINAGEWGLMEFGRQQETVLYGFNTDGSRFDGSAFVGHTWIEIEGMDVIVDGTLMHLRTQFNSDNQMRNIDDEEYLLDESKLVIERSELKTRDQLFSGDTGYSYESSNDITREAKRRLGIQIKDLQGLIARSTNESIRCSESPLIVSL